MRAFTILAATAVPLDLANIDTDQIIPKQFLKTIDRDGLAQGLFYDLRFAADGAERRDFVLNDPRYKGVGILIAGDNFGCGSSREHAPWALMDFGISCVVATSFADIFHDNCFQNGLLPIVLGEEEVRALMGEARGGNHVFAVDLAAQTITAPSGRSFAFEITPDRKRRMLQGLDSIGETLQAADAIEDYEQQRAVAEPWREIP
ncbi:MAG TPA: 3-isopropylmalate dehydratase small subunit [Caulobacteraceae bacterium]